MLHLLKFYLYYQFNKITFIKLINQKLEKRFKQKKSHNSLFCSSIFLSLSILESEYYTFLVFITSGCIDIYDKISHGIHKVDIAFTFFFSKCKFASFVDLIRRYWAYYRCVSIHFTFETQILQECIFYNFDVYNRTLIHWMFNNQSKYSVQLFYSS